MPPRNSAIACLTGMRIQTRKRDHPPGAPGVNSTFRFPRLIRHWAGARGITASVEQPLATSSSNEGDVPFDVRHVRVIYYEMTDPFWGEKLISKVAENIVSALKNPKEAILFEAPKA